MCMAQGSYLNAAAAQEPLYVLASGCSIGESILIGGVAGLWLALGAARMSSTQALWSM
jgi:hypothetical protein